MCGEQKEILRRTLFEHVPTKYSILQTILLQVWWCLKCSSVPKTVPATPSDPGCMGLTFQGHTRADTTVWEHHTFIPKSWAPNIHQQPGIVDTEIAFLAIPTEAAKLLREGSARDAAQQSDMSFHGQ